MGLSENDVDFNAAVTASVFEKNLEELEHGPDTVTGTRGAKLSGGQIQRALCFGWIDGQMERIDENSYKKYFSQRRKNSKWSEKNKALIEKLEQQGIMTDFGRSKIAEAKENSRSEGKWPMGSPKACGSGRGSDCNFIGHILTQKQKRGVKSVYHGWWIA